ncbi:serine/threonine protein phosphatase with TPR repeat [Schizosaccharomyces osmophilus]|uniref:Serine/threonine-protein phosphatase n=1 Tax=Schizosaccharomyces osmophilus TaxID=2545709 RepID=A0AAE9WDV6_9SCHI|nr:serine/threonine protein phosphatase with TPR repeat [Schizosaccharomyces osmophilus]WBW74576.1 serine/threonine protein phosphatase with TPR repeat [Schizosaccharomyces osmophilus]
MVKSALTLKNEANSALKEGHVPKAVELYSEAIKLDSQNAILYSNRSFAYFKLEDYGLAIIDATKAIEIDPNFAKAYYRRASAHISLFQPKEAAKDYKMAVNKAPNDATARSKLRECEGLLKKIRFQEAIQVSDPPSALANINIDDMDVSADYDGVKLKAVMTEEFVLDMLDRFQNGKKLPLKYAYSILRDIKEHYEQVPSMVDVHLKDDETLVVCGDTHGQFFDLLNIFKLHGSPSPTNKYLFNGDFVDRGSWSTEVAFTLYAFKLLYPDSVFLNRGNHETDDMNKVYGFEGECKAKYNERTFNIFSETFIALPLGTLIADTYLVLHGGLFSNDNVTLDQLRKIDRFSTKQPGQSGLMMEMLWTDPQSEPGRGVSKRGVGLQFGPDVSKKFCEANGLRAIIRSHEVRDQGYEVEHDGYCITVFSAPNYCDSTGNKGAVIKVKKDMELDFQQFQAVPHPNIRPMAYANGLLSSM